MEHEKTVTEPFEFLPDAKAVLHNIMRSYISGFIYAALIDSFCCEQNARMTAMDNANRNAEELNRGLGGGQGTAQALRAHTKGRRVIHDE